MIINRLDLPVDSICDEYLSGSTLMEIGNKYGCSSSVIKHRLKENNVNLRSGYLILNENEIIRDYLSGDSPVKIAERFDCHNTTISRRLAQCGIKLRSYSESHIGILMPSDQRRKMSESKLREKSPLSKGQLNEIPPNKTCALHLGVIAENLLIKMFKDVQVMPNQNHGFDFICNRDYKIDVKSSATGHKGRWSFNINKNQIADYFLCVSFESRLDLNPVHLWLIPGADVNHKGSISISKITLSKWSKYEQPIDTAVLCCNEMKIPVQV